MRILTHAYTPTFLQSECIQAGSRDMRDIIANILALVDYSISLPRHGLETQSRAKQYRICVHGFAFDKTYHTIVTSWTTRLLSSQVSLHTPGSPYTRKGPLTFVSRHHGS